MRGILVKEWLHHRWLILALLMLTTCTWLLFAGFQQLSEHGGSHFYNLSWFLWLIFPLFCLILSNAVVADEFRQRTQVFLEGLPISRFVFLATKYMIGLLVVMITALLLLFLAGAMRWIAEAMTPRFALLLVVKTLLWAWFCWAALFALGFLGRYRMLAGMVGIIGLMLMQNALEIQVTRFGPFHLIGDQYAYERQEFPSVAAAYTGGLIALLTFVGFSFGLVRDATLPSLLAEKMSSREKLVITALIFFAMFVAGSVMERQSKTERLNMPGSVDVSYQHGKISAAAAVVAPSDEDVQSLNDHAEFAATILSEVADYLDIEQLPPVYLVHRPDFPANKFEIGGLDSRQGVLFRFNARKTTFDELEWNRFLIRHVLSGLQHYRLESDTRGWVLDGFVSWWVSRNESSGTSLPVEDSEPTKVYALRPYENDLTHWLAFKKKVGDEPAKVWAGFLIATLQQNTQPDQFRNFLSQILSYPATHDVRATLHDYWYSVRYVLRKSTGMELKTLCDASAELIRSQSAEYDQSIGEEVKPSQ